MKTPRLPNQESGSGIPTVSEITDQLRELLEPAFENVLVEGELSNINRSRNGHYYLTLKDRDAQLPCVIWNRTAERLNAELEDGQQVILGGSIQIYPPHGRYQLIVRTLRQAGLGQLQQAFEKLKMRLKEEGLFDAQKKELPPFPLKIGLITSATGAARHDITSTLEHRWPVATLLFYHASVQGANASSELAEALRQLDRIPDLDLIIIGRGGGSLEDLWPFNEEVVARTIFDCQKPVISAVGHEVDFSISDFVADHRAATPTQAAVLATPDINEVRLYLDDLGNRVTSRVNEKIERDKLAVKNLSQSHALLAIREKLTSGKSLLGQLTLRVERQLERRLPLDRKRLDDFHLSIDRQIERFINRRKEVLKDLTHRLETVNPNLPLEQGYVRVWQKETWVRSSDQFNKDDTVELEWREGRVTL